MSYDSKLPLTDNLIDLYESLLARKMDIDFIIDNLNGATGQSSTSFLDEELSLLEKSIVMSLDGDLEHYKKLVKERVFEQFTYRIISRDYLIIDIISCIIGDFDKAERIYRDYIDNKIKEKYQTDNLPF